MRTEASVADADLLAELSAAGYSVSPSQLERWRHRGLLPRAHVTRLPGGGSRVEQHPFTVYEMAAVLAESVFRGGAWQRGALALFECGFALDEGVMRASLRWQLDSLFRAASRLWEEAASSIGLRAGHLDAEAVADIAALAERLSAKHKAVRQLRGVVRSEFQRLRYVEGDSKTVNRAANEALGLRLAALAGAPLDEDLRDIARFGLGGRAPRGMTPVLPDELVACADTLTLREASVLARLNRSRLVATPELDYLTRGWLLELACIDITSLRLNTFPYSVTTPIAAEQLRTLEREATDLEGELDALESAGVHPRQSLLEFP